MFFLTGFLHVYDDRQKALKAVMKIKGARFKAFHNRMDAENFSKGLSDGGGTPSKNSTDKLQVTSPGGFIHLVCLFASKRQNKTLKDMLLLENN